MATPNCARKLLRNGARGAESARDFAAFVAIVHADYFHVRVASDRPGTFLTYDRAVYDSRGRFLTHIPRNRLIGWTRAGWLEEIAHDAQHGKEYLVTDEGRAAARSVKDAA